jgi:DNA repair exonuclease SbcCD nuclease subunit
MGEKIQVKIALIGDQHFGGKSDSKSFNDYIEKFYTKQFFPYLLANNIKTVIDLGDTFDRRKYVNFAILDQVRKFYFDNLNKCGITLYSIVGNHSTYYRNTNNVNSSELLYGHYENVNTYPSPTTITLDGTYIDLIPWINSENYEETMEFIKNSKSQVAFGHLEVEGFAMYKNYVAGTGLKPSIFNRYEFVASGHYHHKSSKGNIHYLGAPYEITWNDYDDPKGFHIFDTETREIEFIKNDYRLFEKIYYDDENWENNFRSLDTSFYTDKIVKLIVENKTKIPEFESFLDRMYKSNPTDLIILEDLSEYTARYSNLEEGEDVEVGNTATFLEEYVDNMPIDHEKRVERKKVKRLLQILYDEALNTDE